MLRGFIRADAADTVDEAARSKSGFTNRALEDFRPVTEDMLENPAAGDWLSWRRTRDVQGYSPLDQINRRNVGKLQLVWSLAMADGSNQVTPPTPARSCGPMRCRRRATPFP